MMEKYNGKQQRGSIADHRCGFKSFVICIYGLGVAGSTSSPLDPWRSEGNLEELVLSYCSGLGGQTQAFRVDGKYLYSLSHHTDPQRGFLIGMLQIYY